MNMKKNPSKLFEKRHMSIRDLKMNDQVVEMHMYQKYLSKNIRDYPTPTEFHITKVAHVTNKTRLRMIWNSGGFKATNPESFLWWSLNINKKDITAAEKRYIKDELFPNRSEAERAAQSPFLSTFTTSPAFSETSRYGNFRFTFPLTELMETYKNQKCDGQEPVLRVFETRLFKQEIEYVVLVHSPQFDEQFRDIPLLTSTSSPVAYNEHKIIWKAQAICETHHFQLETSGKTAEIQNKHPFQFYVWDHVSLVFYTKGILTFPKRKLKASLNCLELDPNINLSCGENCSSLEAAENFLTTLVDDEEEEINMGVD